MMPLRSPSKQRSDGSEAAARALGFVVAAVDDGCVEQDRTGSPGHKRVLLGVGFRTAEYLV
jgi:hypothetical protein